MHAGFWWGNRRKDLVGRLRHRWEDIIKVDLKKQDERHGLD
jgi:hypothetical protein